MAKLSIENLLKKDIKFVEKKKIFFIIPFCILLAGIIAAVAFGFSKGSPLNLGMDFTGGYIVTIRSGSNIDDDNYKEYSDKIESIIDDYRFEYEGKEYPVVLDEIQKLGSKSETSLRIQYRAHKSLPRGSVDDIMKELNEDLVKTLNGIVAVWAPSDIAIDGDTATISYDNPIKNVLEDGSYLKNLEANGIDVKSGVSFVFEDETNPVYKTVTFKFNPDASKTAKETEDSIRTAATIEMYFSAKASSGEMVSGSVRTDLIYGAILAVLITLILMLAYIFIRFEFASGVAAVIALFHDAVIAFLFMVIFRIEINSTFIAVIITLLAYSINNTIIVFDRVRENRKTLFAAGTPATATQIANKSIMETLTRNIFTTFTTLIMIAMIAIVCAIGGITSMVTFALPIIVGLIAGFYSSLLIAPALWVVFKRDDAGTPKSSAGILRQNKPAAAEETKKS